MKRLLLIGTALLTLSACTTTQQSAAVGATAGAIVGGVTTNTVGGAAVGAAVGAVAGVLVARVAGSDDMCYYRDASGDLYRDFCPQG